MDVYSVRFSKCQMVYPHTIVRPLQKYRVSPRPYLKAFINDFKNNQCLIKQFIADNLKRANAREALNHASSFACEYCSFKAVSQPITDKQTKLKIKRLENQISVINEKIVRLQSANDTNEEEKAELKTLIDIVNCLKTSLKDSSKKKSQIVWPSTSMHGEPRTQEKVEDIVNQLSENPDLDKDEAQGFVGKSPFLQLENFNFVRDIPAEYLHNMCLGNVKRLVELTFNVGTNRSRITKRKLTPLASFNIRIINIKSPFEFSRRVRALNFAVWKGQEYRNLILFFFPIVVDCIEEESAQERKLWLFLAFVVRACVLPKKEFQNVDLHEIENYAACYYKLYEKLFGPTNCSYNTHVGLSHILLIRAHGPLTSTSAFGFEHFYGEVRHSFTPGTVSPLKQIMQKILIKRKLGKHVCEPKLLITTHETSLECNNLIYTYRNNKYEFFKIKEIYDDTVKCVKIKTSDVCYNDAPRMKWSKVGHFKLDCITEEEKIIESKFISKAIRTNDTITTCPDNVLKEK